MIKPGRYVVDPQNRLVTVVSVDGDTVTVQFAGPYGATVRLPRSCVRPPTEEELEDRACRWP